MKAKRIKNYEDLLPVVDEVGFLPFFPGPIPDLSLWEYTRRGGWFSGDEENDPWFWRQRAAREGKLAYGKFFSGKAGFVSLKWWPDFVHFRRDGKSFDTLFQQGVLSDESRAVMELFPYGEEYLSFQIRKRAGIQKSFEPTLTRLQHKTFLVIADFSRKRSSKGREYGWPAAVFCKAESLFGTDFVLSRFSEKPEISHEKS